MNRTSRIMMMLTIFGLLLIQDGGGWIGLAIVLFAGIKFVLEGEK